MYICRYIYICIYVCLYIYVYVYVYIYIIHKIICVNFMIKAMKNRDIQHDFTIHVGFHQHQRVDARWRAMPKVAWHDLSAKISGDKMQLRGSSSPKKDAESCLVQKILVVQLIFIIVLHLWGIVLPNFTILGIFRCRKSRGLPWWWLWWFIPDMDWL